MNITTLTASISRRGGGVSAAVRQLSVALGKLPGVCVQVVGLADEYVDADGPLWEPARVEVVRAVPPKSFGFAPELPRVLDKLGPDLVHVHGLWMFVSVATQHWSRRTANPYVITPHGMLNPLSLRDSWWKKRLAGWLYEDAHLRGAACIHSLCESEADSVRGYGLRNPVCVIPNGVDLPDGRCAAAPAWAAELPEGVRVLLYLGRLYRKKGLLDLVRAWANMLPATRDGWTLVIAGWDQGGHQSELMRLARELRIECSVRFVGAVYGEEKSASFARADAFVLPSLSEGLPMAVLEAWAYGLPVVMTPQCNLPEGFQAEAAVCVLPEFKSIAMGLAELFAMSDDERHAMGGRGRRLVEEKFSWPRIAAEMKQVYEWVLGGGTPPACVRLD